MIHAAIVRTEPEPMEWRPMATCPRTAAGRLTEDAWIARHNWHSPVRYIAGSTWPRPECDERFGRVGWLPGHLARADLPPVPAR